MIEVSKVKVCGWEPAIMGARNPMNSRDKSDSDFSCKVCDGCYYENQKNRTEYLDTVDIWCNHTALRIGPNDLALMTRLANAGPDHGKFLRMITVYMDINAPLYWWKEFDTYKVGTVANSCSTMHKIHAKEFTIDDFSHEKLARPALTPLRHTIDILNVYRELFVEWDDKNDNTKNALLVGLSEGEEYNKKWAWEQMIQLLPSSYNQLRTVELNYEVVRRMYHARKNHKLDEWRTLCGEFEKLPYAKELIIGGTKE